MKRLDAQRGFSLLEILAALAIGVLMMTSLTAMVDVSLQDTKSQQVAKYHEQFTAAASRYVNDNAASLYTSAAAGTVPINLGMLSAGGYLPNGFALSNAYQQTPCLLVRRHVSPPGSPNAIDALVVTEGGTAIPPKDLSYVAANAGSGGGQIDLGIPAGPALIGHGSGWALDNVALADFTNTKCSGSSAGNGHLASALFYGGPNGINKDVLYRSFTGDDTLNTMTTPLRMSGVDTIKTVGGACTGQAIAMDAKHNILTCDISGKWNGGSSWKEPVADYPALLALTTPTDGDVHMTLDTGRAFMFKAGTAPSPWMPLAVNQDGDFSVPRDVAIGRDVAVTGNLTATNINATLDIAAGQDIRAARDIQAAQDLRALRDIAATNNITAGVNITATQTVKGNLVIANSAVVSQSLSPTLKRFAAGEGCNYLGLDSTGAVVTYLAFGSIVSDVNGLIMECRATATPPGIPAGSQGVFIYVDGSSQTPP